MSYTNSDNMFIAIHVIQFKNGTSQSNTDIPGKWGQYHGPLPSKHSDNDDKFSSEGDLSETCFMQELQIANTG